MTMRWLMRCVIGLAALVPCHALAQCVNAPPSGQTVDSICITQLVADYTTAAPPAIPTITIRAHWLALGGYNNAAPDKYEIILSETRGGNVIPSADPQIEVGGGTYQGNVVITRPIVPGFEGPPYVFQVEECWNNILAPATCEPWVVVNYVPTPPTSCPNPTVDLGWVIVCPPPGAPPAAPGVKLPPGGYHLSSTPAVHPWHQGLPVALHAPGTTPTGDHPLPKVGYHPPTGTP